MNALSIRKLFLIVICLLAASVLIDFAHMVLSMIIDGVLAVAIVYFLWRIKGQYDKRITELEAEVRLLVSRRPGG
jgi:Flp pilus assembly protein TadB